MYEGGYRDGKLADEIAIHQNVTQHKELALPASSYGEKINYTAIYSAIAGARYFTEQVPVHIMSDTGWQGNFYPYYQGYTFSEIPLNAYSSRINYKDTIAILSRVEEKHQQAKETLEKMIISNISSKKLIDVIQFYKGICQRSAWKNSNETSSNRKHDQGHGKWINIQDDRWTILLLRFDWV